MTTFNPLSENSFNSYDDAATAVRSLVEPLLKFYEGGSAQVRVDGSGACFDNAAISLEGYARPLWALIPYTIGGNNFEHWDIYLDGLKNGTDPHSPYYWGDIPDRDQRLVELAAIGLALATIPEWIYEPLDVNSQKNVENYLLKAASSEVNDSNWRFFLVFIALGLKRIGNVSGEKLMKENLERVDEFYVADGWYRDGLIPGDQRRVDYYVPFAFHFYGLLYSGLVPADSFTEKYYKRSREFVSQFANFFDESGAAIPYGRSLTYRFACGAFWGALPFLDKDTNSGETSQWDMSWGQIKGLYVRHLRWWSNQPLSYANSDLLSVGYSYPNTFFSEPYNSSCSPYWALKAFWPLAVSRSHPFWTSIEEPLNLPSSPVAQSTPGFVFQHLDRNTVMLVSGPQIANLRYSAEKYGKFAYSTRYGFSVECDPRHFDGGVYDNMLAFSEDGKFAHVRDSYPVARIIGNILYSEWQPLKGTYVKTWLLPLGIWHVRVHIVESDRELSTIEGGFSVPRSDFNVDIINQSLGSALCTTKTDSSGLFEIDIGDQDQVIRTGRVQNPAGNTNLLYPRTSVPQLIGKILPNTRTVYVTGVIASPDLLAVETAWKEPPTVPAIGELEKLIAQGLIVGITADTN